MKKKYYNTIEILFMSSMIGLDFAYGLVVGPILTATGILEIIRIDMIIPIMMMLFTRLVVDKFGTLIIYEFVWVILAIMAKPSSFALPGFLKIIPALAYGLILDSCMQIFRSNLYGRLIAAGIAGGIVNQFILVGIRILFGMPWSNAVKIILGINIVTTAIVNIIAIHLVYLVWSQVCRTGWVGRIQCWRTS